MAWIRPSAQVYRDWWTSQFVLMRYITENAVVLLEVKTLAVEDLRVLLTSLQMMPCAPHSYHGVF